LFRLFLYANKRLKRKVEFMALRHAVLGIFIKTKIKNFNIILAHCIYGNDYKKKPEIYYKII